MTDFVQTISEQVMATSWLEWSAVGLAVAYLVLAAHQSLWCWLAAAISCSIYTYLMWHAQLYMETVLQVTYVLLAGYGWWQWRYGAGRAAVQKVAELSLAWHLRWLAILVLVAGAVALALERYTTADAVWLDSYTTVFSLFATWLLTRKQFANWWYWLVIDAVYVYLYASKGFVITGALYFVYLILVFYAMWQWQTARTEQQQCSSSG
ncbi:nicotinamide riboside transporter PnuC [Pseudidiomarina homiensis]|uniref:Nicotinamide riboside transporter PnuC n=1 Tax=Pseudidiomarina homiensis TaxID=364198 RepID=A0A432XY65_9GAMM|nr:nicotinamide riboside transporter PnuC [Pseudidiomarina homiensis]RUO53583.1 nicotinamide mononucleotide transporter [Pseudidiomarina homiensis]